MEFFQLDFINFILYGINREVLQIKQSRSNFIESSKSIWSCEPVASLISPTKIAFHLINWFVFLLHTLGESLACFIWSAWNHKTVKMEEINDSH